MQATPSNEHPRPGVLATVVLTLTLASLLGCRPANQARPSEFLTSNEAEGSVVVQAADCKGCKPASRTFYRISAEQLKRVRGSSGLTYMGSDAEHHFFRAWNKLLEPPEVDHVAVPLGQCAVTEPHTLDEEHALPRVRKLDQSSPSCAVR